MTEPTKTAADTWPVAPSVLREAAVNAVSRDSIGPRRYGHEHRWFAWFPVNTTDHGWQWLRPLYRRMCHVNIQPYPSFWTYNRHPQTRGECS